MIKYFTGLFLFIGCLLASSLSLAQIANVTEGCFPLQVQFTAPGGPSTYFWDFQDGATSDLQNPVNTFTTAGVFNVEFSESPGSAVLGTVTITVYDEPQILISASTQQGCGPLSVDFMADVLTDPGVMITDYQWVFGDGQTASGTSNPTHVFSGVGFYFVSLEITTNFLSCNTTMVIQDFIEVTPGPVADFSTDPASLLVCEGPVSVSFTNQSSGLDPLSYQWVFGNGDSSNVADPPPVEYTVDGTYPISLTVFDASGCQTEYSQTLQLGQPAASFLMEDTVCAGVPVIVQNLSGPGIYQWDFGPEATPSTTTLALPTVTFNTQGTYPVTLTVQSANGACSTDTTALIYVEDIEAEIFADPTYSCSNPFDVDYSFTGTNIDQWQWTFGDGDTSTLADPTHTYFIEMDSFSINEELFLTTFFQATSPAGCELTVTRFDTLHPPNALFMPDVVDGCAPLTVTFSDSSTSNEDLVSWQYLYGDGSTALFNNDDPHSYTFSQPGEYEVKLVVTNAAGCMDTSYAVLIEVGDILAPDFTVDQTNICPGQSVQFTDLTVFDSIDVWHYTTDEDRMFHCFDDPDPSWTFEDQTGFIDVTLTVGYNGCYSSVTQSDLIFIEGPLADIDYLINCEDPFTVQFADSSQMATNVEWDFGNGDMSTDQFPVYTYPATGDYEVVLTAFNAATGCPPSTDTMTVSIRDISSVITLDSILCRDAVIPLDGSLSIDVDDSCRRGYTWQFSDPTMRPITTPMPGAGVTFNNSGPVTVTLITEDLHGCKDTSSVDVQVYGIDASFMTDKSVICYPGDVEFTDGSTADTTIISWDWVFGDGSTSTDQNPFHTYMGGSPVSVPIDLVIFDAVGCSDTVTQNLGIYTPIADIFLEPQDTNICTGVSTTFSASDFNSQGSFLNYMWDFGDGFTSTDSIVTHEYSTAGDYSVILQFVEDSTGCAGSTSVNLQVQDFPDVGFETDVDDLDVLCNPQSVIFTDTSASSSSLSQEWIFGNGETASGPMAGTVYGKGTYTAMLVVSSTFGCRDTVRREFTIEGPEGDFVMDDDTICKGESILFTLVDTTEVGTYEWFFGDGTSSFGVNPVLHTYDFLPPTFQTVATLLLNGVDNACSATVEKEIYFHEVLAEFLRNDGIDTALCQGPYPFFDSSLNASAYVWNFGDGTTSTEQNPVHNFPEPGTYPVSLSVSSDIVGCQDTITKDIVILPDPIPVAIGDTIDLGCEGEISIQNPQFFSQYSWLPAEVFLDNSEWSQVVAPLVTTVYGLEEIDENGCMGFDTTIVVVNEVRDVYIPNAFTPNYDGINDRFTVFGGKSVSLVRDFKIFNRWGGLVFEAQNFEPNNLNFGWDGTLNGRRLNNDVFVYYAEVEFIDLEVISYSGDVTLIK